MNLRTLSTALVSIVLGACGSVQPLPVVDDVDLPRFMGDWYVIANIPTFLEKDAHNAVETYQLNADGSIATTFSFRDGGFGGERKTYHPRGFVSEHSNAIWGMQFVWPVKADYRVFYLDDDYEVTVIGRNKRDFVWIMAREPHIDDDRYSMIIEKLEQAGYNAQDILKVPQQW